MASPSEPITPLVGLSLSAATLIFSVEYDAAKMARNSNTTEEDYRALLDSRMKLVEYISSLEKKAGVPPETFYRRD